MKYIPRELEKHIKNNLFKGKIIIVYGPRQGGKTTMIKHLVGDMPKVEYYSCDNIETRSKRQDANEKELGDFVHGKKLIIIDEAQLVSDIGLTLKLMHDTYPDVQIIASGSSSFELANKTKEPLTGRSLEYVLLPLSFKEISNYTSTNYYQKKCEGFFKVKKYCIITIWTLQKSQSLKINKFARHYTIMNGIFQ